jgi:manganese/zinc/iron transport system substrate-binding protein
VSTGRPDRKSRSAALWHRACTALAAAVFAVAAQLPVTSAKAGSAKLDIVATTSMIADAVRQVGGDEVRVRALMGPGIDPHAYRQTRTDVAAMTRADLVFWHGLYLEAQLEEFMHKLAQRRSVFAVAESLPQDRLLRHDNYANKYDPHVWMDPQIWTDVIAAVRDALIAARPNARATFETNAARYIAEVEILAAYAADTLRSVSKQTRYLVTAHDAFNYFGRAFGFEVIGIQGISTESEAGLHRIAELVSLLVQKNVTVVFVESSVSDRNVRALIEGAAARGQKVSIGGELFSDAMGADSTYEGSYIGMLDHNVTTIARALGGTAPTRGMNNRLSAGS